MNFFAPRFLEGYFGSFAWFQFHSNSIALFFFLVSINCWEIILQSEKERKCIANSVNQIWNSLWYWLLFFLFFLAVGLKSSRLWSLARQTTLIFGQANNLFMVIYLYSQPLSLSFFFFSSGSVINLYVKRKKSSILII